MHTHDLAIEICLCPSILIKRNKLMRTFYTVCEIDYPSFLTRRTFRGGDPLYLKFWGKLTPSLKNADF